MRAIVVTFFRYSETNGEGTVIKLWGAGITHPGIGLPHPLHDQAVGSEIVYRDTLPELFAVVAQIAKRCDEKGAL